MPGEAYSKARRAAQEWVQVAVDQGKTGNQIVKILQESGFGYRREDVLDDVKRIREQGTDAAAFRSLDPQALIPVELVREVDAGMMVLKEAFRADYTVEWHDVNTGAVYYRKLSLSFGAPMSVNALQANMRSIMNDNSEKYEGFVASAYLLNVFAKAVEDWEA